MAIDGLWILRGRKNTGTFLRHLAWVTEQRSYSSRQGWRSVVVGVEVGCKGGGEMMSLVQRVLIWRNNQPIKGTSSMWVWSQKIRLEIGTGKLFPYIWYSVHAHFTYANPTIYLWQNKRKSTGLEKISNNDFIFQTIPPTQHRTWMRREAVLLAGLRFLGTFP